MTGKGINGVVKRLARRTDELPYAYEGCGIPSDMSAHRFRCSVAWRMLQAGEGNALYDLRNRLRHATIQTTEQKYDQYQAV